MAHVYDICLERTVLQRYFLRGVEAETADEAKLKVLDMDEEDLPDSSVGGDDTIEVISVDGIDVGFKGSEIGLRNRLQAWPKDEE